MVGKDWCSMSMKRKYIKCDCCGKRIYFDDECYGMNGRCGKYCSGKCFAYAYADTIVMSYEEAVSSGSQIFV